MKTGSRIKIGLREEHTGKLYRLLAETMNDGAAILDENGTILYCNTRLAKMLAATLKSLTGSPIRRYVLPASLNAFTLLLTGTRSSSAHRSGLSMLDKKGRTLQVRISTSRIDSRELHGHCIVVTELASKQKSALAEESADRKRTERHIEHLASFPGWDPNPIVEIGRDGTILYYNNPAIKIAEELGFADGVRAFLPGDIGRILRLLDNAEGTLQLTREITMKSRTFHENILISGKLKLVRIYALDISQRKQAEEELRPSHEQSQIMAEATFEGIVFSEKGRITDVNRQFTELTGYTKSDLIGKDIAELIHPNDQTAVVPDILTDQEHIVEHRLIRKDGLILAVEAHGKMWKIRDRQVRITAVRDITDRKRMEEALRESGELFKAIASNTPDHILVQDRDLRYSFVINPQLGLTVKEMIGKTDFDFLRKEEAETLTRIKRQVLETGKPLRMDISLLSQDGEKEYFDGSYIPKFDEKGEINGLIGYFRNVTDRKRTEVDLEESKERFRAIAESTPVGIGIVSISEAKFIYVNPAYEKSFGYSPGELHGRRTPDIYYDPADRDRILGILKEHGIVSEYEVRLKHKDGTPFWTLSSIRPITYGGTAAYLGSFIDITERKRTEEALRTNQATLQGILDASKESIWLFSPDGNMLMGNPTAIRRFGKPAGQIIGRHFSEILPEELARDRLARLKESVDSKQPIEFEDERAGIVFRHSFYPVVDDSGNVTSVACFSRDITEGRRVERQIQHLASFPEMNPNPILEVDQDGNVIYTNAAAADILRESGVEPDARRFLPVDMQKIISEMKKGGKNQSVFREVKIQERIFGERIYSIPAMKVVRIYTWEVTESRKTEDARRRMTERFKLLSDVSGRLLAAENPQGIIEELCSAVMAHLGCQMFFNFVADPTVDRLRLNAYAGISHEEGAKIEWLDYGAAICGCVALDKKPIVVEDIRNSTDARATLVKKFGAQAYACHPLIAGNRIVGTLSFGTTERTSFTADELSMMKTVADQIAIAMDRIQSAETIRESELHLSRAQEIAHLGSWELDLLSNRLTWSDEVYRIFGLEPRQFAATYEAFLEAIHPDDRAGVNSAYTDSIKNGLDSYEIEHRIVRKSNGEIRVVHERCRHVRDDNGTVVRSIGMVHDITERRNLEEALRTSRDALELRVQERTAELMRANVSLQEEIDERIRAQAAVVAEQKRFHDVLDDLPVYVVLLTKDYHARYANREFISRFGEAGGRTCHEFLFGFSKPCENCETYKVLQTNSPQRWEWTGPDGKNYDIYDFPFTDVDGSTLILEMGLDITEKKKAEESLRVAKDYNRSLLEASLDPLVTIGADGKITDVNAATEAATGRLRAELIGTDFSDYFTEPKRASKGYKEVFKSGSVHDYELEIRHRDGKLMPVLYNASLYWDETAKVMNVFAAARDITATKAEERRRNLIRTLLELFARKSSSKEYLDSVVEVIHNWTKCDALGIRITDSRMHIPYSASVGFKQSFLDLENDLSLQNDSCFCIHSISQNIQEEEGKILTQGGSFRCSNLAEFIDAIPERNRRNYRGNCLKFGCQSVALIPIRYRDKILGAIHLVDQRPDYFSTELVEFLETISPLIGEAIFRFYTENELARHRDHLEDLVEQRTHEIESVNEALRATSDYLNNLLNYANAPIIVWDKHYTIVRFNHAFERLTGRTSEEVIGGPLDILFPPETTAASMNHIRQAVSGKRMEVVEIPITHKNGTVRTVLWNSATIFEPDGVTPAATIAQGQDITDRKNAEKALVLKTEELARSNSDLEQFASIASHDLQEPLRMISSYVQLLAERYKGRLDTDADEFITFAVDGASRMQRLINDLLAYSRVGSREKKLQRIRLESVLDRVLDILKLVIGDASAVITHDPLPEIVADETQMVQLLQNLIGNAIKFRADRPPKIHLSAENRDDETVISVRDNGIGIPSEYKEKIFTIFTRLHTQGKYPGTGIGLAICKRIVEQHGGHIWIESTPGEGSTFHFTIGTGKD